MIKQEYLGKKIELTDCEGKKWNGKVNMITSALDSDSEENELTIEFSGRLVEFREKEIRQIVCLPS